jgi:flagellar motor switch protein FliM
LTGVLSQKEIDELLLAISSGDDSLQSDGDKDSSEDGDLNVKPYNFRTANKFPKEQIRTLQLIFENYSRRLSIFLSGKLRVLCEVEVASIEEQSFSEFNNSIPSPAILAIANMAPLQGNVLYEVSPLISYEIISRLFGGTGQDNDSYKPFTEIELSILERMVRNMLKIMDEAWEKVIPLNTHLERIETSTQFAQIVENNEPIAIVTMNVNIGKISDTINLCIPHIAVQPVAKKLAMRKWYSDFSENASTDIKTDIKKSQLAETQLNLHTVFNDTRATVKEVLGLQVGDVIRIDHSLDQPITVKIEHMPKLKGIVGTHGSKYAVKITEIIRRDED